ncbi:MAG TPA: WD40 repeat domain-containing protein, partial [Caulobacteraceae bacterium]
MTISIDSSLLLSYYDLKAGVPQSATGSGSAAVSTSTAPTTPWAKAPTTAQTNSLVQSLLNGQSLINPGAAKLSVPAGTPNYTNYKNLFGLYQGLTALQDLATQAGASGTSAYQLNQLQIAFASGLKQVQTYLNTQPFVGFNVAEGAVATSSQSSAGVPTETDTYKTGVLWSGDANTAVPAFAGNVQFSLSISQTPLTTLNANITQTPGAPAVVNFNLNDLGSTPRTISNVVSYLNSQLQAAGVFTRFADVRTPGTSTTYQVNGVTHTTPVSADQYSLQIVGNAVETLSFSAPTTAPAVYITQTAGAVPNTPGSGTAGVTTTGASGNATGNTTSDVTQQLLKLTTDPAAANARLFTDTLGATIPNAIATAAGANGSVYVLANVTGATQAGQVDSSHAISGTQDVALLKYDSAGNLIFTQTLGSTASASGLGLAVSADGSQVAVVGHATGLLDDNGGAPPDATDQTGFVSVYDSSGGQLWTQAVNAWTGGQVNSVAFGADNSVYVAGSTAISDTVSDGYISGFSSTGAQTFNTFLGVTSNSTVNSIAVNGSSLITAGVQNGDAVVQSYALQPSGAPVLSATRDLGPLDGGNVTGVAVNSDGSIIVAGSTQNGALSAGTIGSAYGGGEEAFVASLAANLTPSSSDTLAYFTGASDTTATALTVADGQVYIAGQIATTPTPGSGDLTAFDGYAARIDPTTGAVTWSNTFDGPDHQAAPDSIAVDPAGASALDALGLPTGTISFQPSQTLLTDSSLQVGEQFLVKSNLNALAQTVTIAANDTLQTLAQKITQASGYAASVQVVTGTGGVQQLKITPTSSASQITLEAGPAGRNALPALGLSEGLVTTNATAKAKSASTAGGAIATTSLKANYALGLESSLSLGTPAGISNALAQLGGAITTVKQIYTDMTTKPSTQTAGYNGPVPAYLTAEIAN